MDGHGNPGIKGIYNMVTLQDYIDKVIEVALSNIGFGESSGNNQGPFLKAIGAPQGSNWCAGFARYPYIRAAELLGVRCPFDTDTLGAKRLVQNMGAVGWTYTSPAMAMPGDLVAWHRGWPITWRGHVGIVLRRDPHDGIVTTIEGNKGKFPSKVNTHSHNLSKERVYLMATLRGVTLEKL